MGMNNQIQTAETKFTGTSLCESSIESMSLNSLGIWKSV